MKRVYLAGPEVFLGHARLFADWKKDLCRHYGLQGLFPLDAELRLEDNASPPDTALAIFQANCHLIRSCDLLIANLSPFRGPSADPGTAYELGYAQGLGIPTYAYSEQDSEYHQRVKPCTESSGSADNSRFRDIEGLEIENFGLQDNLMLVCGLSAPLFTGHSNDAFNQQLSAFERCLAFLQVESE